ncbi:MAG: PIN domain-containing protein [Blastocatellia bacterium]
MNRIFVDTSAWDAIADSVDQHHEEALLLKEEIAGNYSLATTTFVLDELWTLLLLNAGYQRTVEFKKSLDILADAGILEVVHVSEEMIRDAWAVFERFNVDKQWSFTDCVSYVVMKQQGISEAFAFDHHFEQMGFIRRP